MIQAQCDLSNLKDQISYKESSLQRALTERDNAKREVQLTEQRLEAEQQLNRDMQEDLKKLREIMVRFGEEQHGNMPKFVVSLERQYGRIEGMIKEMLAKYKKQSYGTVSYQPDMNRRPLPF